MLSLIKYVYACDVRVKKKRKTEDAYGYRESKSRKTFRRILFAGAIRTTYKVVSIRKN